MMVGACLSKNVESTAYGVDSALTQNFLPRLGSEGPMDSGPVDSLRVSKKLVQFRPD